MEILRIVLTVIYVIDCVALTVVVLMQEGKQQGLGAIAGIADTYWGKNKGRSAEGNADPRDEDYGDFVYYFVNGFKHELLRHGSCANGSRFCVIRKYLPA